jgi:hypothetical protein
MAKEKKNSMHGDAKKDEDGDNGHKITIIYCDGNG